MHSDLELALQVPASKQAAGHYCSCTLTTQSILPFNLQVPETKEAPGHYRYELRGVVVHSGTAFAGHYYSYIKV